MKLATSRPSRKEVRHATGLRTSALAAHNPNERTVVPASRLSIAGVERLILKAKERALILNPFGKGKSIADWADASITAIHSEGWMKDKAEIARGAGMGDKESVALMAEAVSITTENIVNANSNWVRYFEQRSLGEEDFPVINPDRVGMAVAIDAIGQDGGNRTIQAQLDDPSPIFCPLHMRASNWIEYPLVDAYHGSKVKDLALAQFDVARDRAWRTDALLGSYLLYGGANTRLTATFITTGDITLRDYYAHSRVNVANLPAGNFVELAGNSTTSAFRKEAFDAIIQYCRSWGEDVMEGGSPRPVEVTVASKHVTAFLSQVSLTTQSNFVVDQIFEGGMVLSYGGYTWIVTGDNTIDPNSGIAYVRTDLPVGLFFDKPSLAKTIQDETPALQAANKGRVCEVWCEGFAMPVAWRKRTFGVRYMTPT